MSLASINTELENITGTSGSLVENIKGLIDGTISTYSTIQAKEGTIPEDKNTENIASAIEGIPHA